MAVTRAGTVLRGGAGWGCSPAGAAGASWAVAECVSSVRRFGGCVLRSAGLSGLAAAGRGVSLRDEVGLTHRARWCTAQGAIVWTSGA